MAQRKSKHCASKSCPFWSTDDRRCTVSANGLFIPLERHIVSYCTTENFTSCIQFKKELQLQANSSKAKFNRRKHRRIPGKQLVTLHRLSGSGGLNPLDGEKAQVVNLSKGGMQINLLEPLSSETILDYSFRTGEAHSPPEGIAEVKWCIYEKESKKYFAGLSFHH